MWVHGYVYTYIPVSLKHTLLLRKPLPFNTAAETDLRPLIWYIHMYICIHICIHTCVYIYIYIYICT